MLVLALQFSKGHAQQDTTNQTAYRPHTIDSGPGTHRLNQSYHAQKDRNPSKQKRR